MAGEATSARNASQNRMRAVARTASRRWPVLLLVASLAGAPPVSAQSDSPGERLPVHKVTLDNGMRVLILPRRGAPTVSFVVLVTQIL